MRSLSILIAVITLSLYSAFANPSISSESVFDSTYTFGAFDKLTGKRLPATFKISFNKNAPLVIQGTTESDIQFKPSVKGLYEVEISYPNYITRKIPLNLENLGAGKTNFKEVLEIAIDEYIILITDAQDKQIITSANVKVFTEDRQEIEAKVNPKTGEWKVNLEKNLNYILQIEAAGYQTYSNKLTPPNSKFVSINLQKNASQIMAYTSIDAITKKPIIANYKVLRPEQESLTGSSADNKPYKVEINPQKKFTLEVSADGYKSITDPIAYDASKKDKEIPKVFELQKTTYSFLFKIIDVQTKEYIISTKLRIVDIATGQSIAAKIEKEGFSANLSPNTEYSVEAESEGYEQTNQSINLKELIKRNQFVQEILLVKKVNAEYRLIVVDEETNANIPNANLRIFNTKNEPITIKPSNVQSEWLADLKIAESYTAEVKAQGYLAYRAALSKNSKTITLRVKKVPTQEIYFTAVDAYTKNLLPSEYKLMNGTSQVNGTINPEKTRLKATLIQDKSYDIEVVSEGYLPYKGTVNPTTAINTLITIELRKGTYTFDFNPIDSKTKELVVNVKMTLIGTDNQTIVVNNNTNKKEFKSNLSPEKKYTLKAESPDYQPYTEEIDLNKIALSAAFKHELLMIKIEKPIVKKEPEIKAEAPPIVKKEEPVVVAPVVTPKEPEKKQPEAPKATAIADEYFKGLEVGKRIKLENVYFEQSQPTIKPQSFSELDKLVNLLKQNPKLNIEVIGHTDNVGDPRMNVYLSEQRAKVVTNYLFNKGIKPDRLSHAGKGQQEPVAANDTEENRQKNRRVEFMIKED